MLDRALTTRLKAIVIVKLQLFLLKNISTQASRLNCDLTQWTPAMRQFMSPTTIHSLNFPATYL